MPYIGNPPAERFTSFDYQDLTGGSGTSFTLDNTVGNPQEIEVFVNNVRQEPGVAYTVSGTALTMTGSIATTDDFYVVFQGKAIQTATHPSDRALTATDGTFTGDLTVDTNTLIVDSANNKVGIGTTSPTYQATVFGSSQSTLEIESGSDTGESRLYFTDPTTTGVGTIEYHHNGNTMRFQVNSAERMRLTADGLTFNGDTAATNALDDYEEGTWTVNLYKGGSALAVGSRYGYYTKVGRLLYISFYWYNNSITTTGSSNYTIQGMPYSLPHASSSGWQFIPTGYMNFGSNEVHRWQVNATDTLTLYGNSATDNASGTIEFSGAGVFFTS